MRRKAAGDPSITLVLSRSLVPWSSVPLCWKRSQPGDNGSADPCLRYAVPAVYRSLCCAGTHDTGAFSEYPDLYQVQFSSLILAYLMMNIIFMGILYLLPFYLTAEMHFDLATSGLFLLIPPAVIALLSIPFGQWSDQCGPPGVCRRGLRRCGPCTAPLRGPVSRKPGLFRCCGPHPAGGGLRDRRRAGLQQDH